MLKNINKIFGIHSPSAFLQVALEVFRYQYSENEVYRKWVDLLQVRPSEVTALDHIPFMPVEFFKNFTVLSSPATDQTVRFTSSGTSSQIRSVHHVNDPELYKKSFLNGFRLFYGDPSEYCILALLPSYLERQGSSLVFMCDELIKNSGHPLGGFFLHNFSELAERIQELKKTGQKVLLIGVSYALMDLCDTDIILNENFIVMETGGMKGTRKEMLKQELHGYLKRGFKINTIHSEYGMTELLSQAYSRKDGLFDAPPWMRFLVREVDDPLKIRHDQRTGGINVIDLANIHSCAFIATKDLGRINHSGQLEIMGRYDQSDVRGCNLMIGNY